MGADFPVRPTVATGFGPRRRASGPKAALEGQSRGFSRISNVSIMSSTRMSL